VLKVDRERAHQGRSCQRSVMENKGEQSFERASWIPNQGGFLSSKCSSQTRLLGSA
jgi:hypothetical protein